MAYTIKLQSGEKYILTDPQMSEFTKLVHEGGKLVQMDVTVSTGNKRSVYIPFHAVASAEENY